MKKLKFLLLILFALILSGCEPASYCFDVEELQTSVSKVELVTFENDNPRFVKVYDNDFSLNMSSMTVISVLDEEHKKEFISEINKITLFLFDTSVNSPFGYAIILITSNEDMIVISRSKKGNKGYGICAKFTKSGEFIEFYAVLAEGASYNSLLIKYFGVSISNYDF